MVLAKAISNVIVVVVTFDAGVCYINSLLLSLGGRFNVISSLPGTRVQWRCPVALHMHASAVQWVQ